MKVTVLCVKPKKFKIISWLILRFTKAGFSHVAISMKDRWLGIRKTFDAVAPHTRMLAIDRFKEHYTIVKAYTLELSDELAKEMERKAVRTLGTNYSFKGVLSQAARILGFTKRPYMDGLSTVYCSEFVTWLVATDSLAKGESMNLDEFDKWIAERARPVSEAMIERINNARILESDKA
jgi:hypothetical protein